MPMNIWHAPQSGMFIIKLINNYKFIHTINIYSFLMLNSWYKNQQILIVRSNFRRDQMNVWRRRRCTRDTTFSARSQKCVSKRAVKRQESLCRAQPNAHPCQNKCEPAPVAGPPSTSNAVAPGSPCLWTEAPLEPFGLNPTYFLQCNPTSLGLECSGDFFCRNCVWKLSVFQISLWCVEPDAMFEWNHI